MSAKVKVLLDTDLGSDIDDSVCLAYLLAESRCELVGITTVSGEPVKRAMMASALCKVAGMNVPIYPGCPTPMLIPQHQPLASQSVALTKWSHDTEFPQGQAVSFMRDLIRSNPGEIVLLAIGPMTNVATLFTIDPEIPSLIKGLVMMIGAFTNRLAGVGPTEWNAICDPHAAAVVYQHKAKMHRSIGLDVTCQVTMPAPEVRTRFQAPLLRPVLDFAEVWFKHVDKITFHDPLAAVTIFDDKVCTFDRGDVSVELASQRVLGMTHWTGNADGAHEAALGVDAPRFFDKYFGVF